MYWQQDVLQNVFLCLWLEFINYPHTFWKPITYNCKNVRNDHSMDRLRLVHDLVGNNELMGKKVLCILCGSFAINMLKPLKNPSHTVISLQCHFRVSERCRVMKMCILTFNIKHSFVLWKVMCMNYIWKMESLVPMHSTCNNHQSNLCWHQLYFTNNLICFLRVPWMFIFNRFCASTEQSQEWTTLLKASLLRILWRRIYRALRRQSTTRSWDPWVRWCVLSGYGGCRVSAPRRVRWSGSASCGSAGRWRRPGGWLISRSGRHHRCRNRLPSMYLLDWCYFSQNLVLFNGKKTSKFIVNIFLHYNYCKRCLILRFLVITFLTD